MTSNDSNNSNDKTCAGHAGSGRSRTGLLGVLVVCAAVGLLGMASGVSQDGEGAAPTPDLGRMLARTIASVEGCYGVELAQTESRKSVIMAWFEDKAAVLRWYEHPMHRRLRAGAGEDEWTPLEHVPDEAKNLLVIATVTFSEGERLPGFPMPISQISIETYQAMPTGISINGRLSPSEMKVPHMQDHTIELEGRIEGEDSTEASSEE